MTLKDTEPTDLFPICPQPSLPNQRNQQVAKVKTVKTFGFVFGWQGGHQNAGLE